MTGWPAQPVLYEINTVIWLQELSRRNGRRVTLGEVPAAAWDEVALPGVDAVWLMGVWERSPAGLRIAERDEALRASWREALADLRSDDVVGSPYCVRDYVVDPVLGGPDGLAAARAELAGRGVRLLLDYVPNHVAPDHPWLTDHPEYFVQGGPDDLARSPDAFLESAGHVFARGRDPYFPAWPDVVQLNAFSERLRTAAADTLASIGDQADGVRCDMAMLLINEVFARTWGDRVGGPPAEEFWMQVIPEVRRRHPGMLFVAEAYWDLEWALQRQGFDYCYDKRLYDRLLHEGAGQVRAHLLADIDYQRGLVRFLENHDEPGRPRPCRATGSGRRRWSSRPCPASPSGTRDSSKAGGSGRRSSSPAGQRSPPTRTCAASTTTCSPRSRRPACARDAGNCSTASAGRTTRPTRTCSPGAGLTATVATSRSSTSPPILPKAGCRCLGRASWPAVAADRAARRHHLRTGRRQAGRPGTVRRAGRLALAPRLAAAVIEPWRDGGPAPA
jgi:Alpha amylase, catalytic domain